jgi:hypothetical protein
VELRSSTGKPNNRRLRMDINIDECAQLCPESRQDFGEHRTFQSKADAGVPVTIRLI